MFTVTIMFFRKLAAVAGVCIAAATLPAFGQTSTPEQLLLRSAAAAKAGDWGGYAAVLHPEAQRAFRELMLPILEADASGRVAEALLQRPAAEAAKLPDAAFVASVFAGLTRLIPAYGEAIANVDMQPIGTIPEGKDLLHLVYRMRTKADDIGIQRTQVASFKRHGAEWRLMLTGSIDGLAASLRRMAPR